MPQGDDFNLQRFLESIGYRCRKDYRQAEASATLRTMHGHFKAGRKCKDLKKGQKRAWHAVLGHNECDVLGTRELLLIAAGARQWDPPET